MERNTSLLSPRVWRTLLDYHTIPDAFSCIIEARSNKYTTLQDWALEEGNLHRALASKILSNFSRNSGSRPAYVRFFSHQTNQKIPYSVRKKGSNMDRIKNLRAMIFQDNAPGLSGFEVIRSTCFFPFIQFLCRKQGSS